MTKMGFSAFAAALMTIVPQSASAAAVVVEYSGTASDYLTGAPLSPFTIKTTFDQSIASIHSSGTFADTSYKYYYGTDNLVVTGLDGFTMLPNQYLFYVQNAANSSVYTDLFMLTSFYYSTGRVGNTLASFPATAFNSVDFPTAPFSAPVSGSYENGTKIYGLVGTVTISASAVPEPATWAMMILGFAAIGGTLRARRRQQVKVRFAL